MKLATKVILLVTILLTLIIGAGIFTTRSLAAASKVLDGHISHLENMVRNGEWDEADGTLLTIEKEWGKNKGVWATLIDHMEIDSIDITLAKLSRYIETRETSSALAEASTLSKLVRHIPRKVSFNIENIL
jgi:ABC-type protease/lipase transport system fused ATPase/permease subunit